MTQENEVPTVTLKLKRVTWRVGQYSAHYAGIGPYRIGTVSWKVSRDSKDWVARVSFVDSVTSDFNSLDEAKAWVEAEALRQITLIAETSSE
jgi:hypothetical protein